MNVRWTGSLAVLGSVVSLAIGPGLTLTRCLLTGEVMLSSCCETPESAHHPDVLDSADSCCSTERLVAPWTSAQVPVHTPSVAPVVSTAFVGAAVARAEVEALIRLPASDSAPPLWRGSPRV